MTAFKRIQLALRATVAETPRLHYLLTLMLLAAVTIITLYIRWKSGTMDRIIYLTPASSIALLSGLAFFPAVAYTVGFFSKRLKEAKRAESFFALPLANGERFTVSMLYGWVFVPLITYGPLFLVGLLTYVVKPNWLMMPDIAYFLPVLPISLAVFYLFSSFLLFPAIFTPRRLGLAVGIILGVCVGGTYLMHEVLPNPSLLFDLDLSSFTDPSTVGMSEIVSPAKEEIPTSYYFSEPNDGLTGLLPMLLALPFFLTAAYRALTLKQA